jgi:ascorbate-specific PTS system EIIC-type component UlaA
MKSINTMRRFAISVLILLIVVILEIAYFGMHPKNNYYMNNNDYSVTAPFFAYFSFIVSPTNILFLVIVFIISFMVVSNMISTKKKDYKKAQIKQVRK